MPNINDRFNFYTFNDKRLNLKPECQLLRHYLIPSHLFHCSLMILGLSGLTVDVSYNFVTGQHVVCVCVCPRMG